MKGLNGGIVDEYYVRFFALCFENKMGPNIKPMINAVITANVGDTHLILVNGYHENSTQFIAHTFIRKGVYGKSTQIDPIGQNKL